MSLFIAAVTYRDAQGRKRTAYHNFFSTSLNHDDYYVRECLNELFRDHLEQFRDVAIWSDCADHFRSKETLATAFDLSQQYGKRVQVNYFTEYHGKSLVDGHFGLLSRWYNEISATTPLFDIHALVNELEFRAATYAPLEREGRLEAYFHHYDPSPRDNIRKLEVTGIRRYLSYLFVDGTCLRRALGSMAIDAYTAFPARVTVCADARQTRVAPEARRPVLIACTVMPAQCASRLRARMLDVDAMDIDEE